MTDPSNKSAGDNPASLFGDVLLGFTRLVKGELALARAEAERSLRDAARALGILAIAALLGITALTVLSGAMVAGLVRLGMPLHWAAVVVGVGCCDQSGVSLLIHADGQLAGAAFCGPITPSRATPFT